MQLKTLLLLVLFNTTIVLSYGQTKPSKKQSTSTEQKKSTETKANTTQINESVQAVEEMDEVLIMEAPNEYSGYSNGNNSKSSSPIGNGYSLINISENYRSFYGINDKNGKVILPSVFTYIHENNNFVIAEIGNLVGVYDLSMKRILPFEYSSVNVIPNLNFLLTSSSDYKNCLFDKTGKQIQIENAANFNVFYGSKNIENKYLIVRNSNYKTAVYDLASQKFIRDYDNCDYTFLFGDAISINKYNPKTNKSSFQLLDLNFKPLSSNLYSVLYNIYDSNTIIANLNGKFGLIDDKEKQILAFEYDLLTSNGTIPATLIAKKK